jgi:hypothetical protein
VEDFILLLIFLTPQLSAEGPAGNASLGRPTFILNLGVLLLLGVPSF